MHVINKHANAKTMAFVSLVIVYKRAITIMTFGTCHLDYLCKLAEFGSIVYLAKNAKQNYLGFVSFVLEWRLSFQELSEGTIW